MGKMGKLAVEIQKLAIEFLGTTLLVVVVLFTGNFLMIGAALAVAIFLGGSISGGAFNPAVAFCLYLAGKLTQPQLVSYTIMELAGASAGYHLYKYWGFAPAGPAN